MSIFRQFKQERPSTDDVSISPLVSTETFISDGSEYLTKKVFNSTDYGSRLDMPSTDEYSLEIQLKNGDIPREVPVSGVLNPTDPSDPRVSAELSDMAEQLHSLDENFNINN